MIFITLFQKLVWILLKPIFHLFFNYSIEGKENLQNLKGPIIIAANHKSNWDPFLLGAALSFNSSLWPLRFMAEKRLFNTFWLNFLNKIGLLKLFFYLSGSFAAIRGTDLKEALAEPIKILQKDKGTVVIFIEGERVPGENLGKGKKGAAALSIMTGVLILPIVTKFNKSPRVKIGKSFNLQRISSPEDDQFIDETKYVMDHLVKLYYS